jgi:putative endonuclease
LYYTYIIKSLKDNGYYFGHCSDIRTRIKRHNTGKVRSTKNRTPFILHYSETFPTKSLAFRREIFFKTYAGRVWLIQNNIIHSTE